MTRYCPFCGTQIDEDSRPGGLPGTVQCPTCSQEVDRSQPAPAPPPLPQSPIRPSQAPAWEGEDGFFSRIWATIWQVLLHPVMTFSAPGKAELTWPMSFGLILGTLGGAAQAFWDRALGWETFTSGDGFWWIIVQPLKVLFSLFISSAILHFMLWILRGAHKGFSQTFRVLGYTQAASIFLLVPGLGLLLNFVWGLVVVIGGLAAAQDTTRWRVFWAMFLPFLFMLVIAILITLAVGLGLILGLLKEAGRQGLFPL
ncbi:MAG: Yip1 family protein [Desulfarculaceae bacterium]